MADPTIQGSSGLRHQDEWPCTSGRVLDAYNAAVRQYGMNPRNKRIFTTSSWRISTRRSMRTSPRANRRMAVLQKAAPPAGTPAKPLTAEQQLKQQQSDAAQETQGKLAKSKEDQLKEFQTEHPDVAAAIKSGSATGNYVPGVAPTSSVPDAATGQPQTLYSTPSTVTLTVPKTKDELQDKQAMQDEKDRLLARKALDKDIGGMFVSTTGKTPTADSVFGSGGLQFGPDGKVIKNNTGLIFQGSPEAYYAAQKVYNATEPPPQADRDTMKTVTIPATDYQRAMGRYNQIVGPENAVPSAVQKEVAARQMLDAPAPDTNLAVPDMALRGPVSWRAQG